MSVLCKNPVVYVPLEMSTLPKCLTIIRNLHRNRIEFEANQLSVRLLGWAVQDAVSSSCQLSPPAVQTNEDDESHRWAISQIRLGLTVYSTVHLLAFPRKMRCRKKKKQGGLRGGGSPPFKKKIDLWVLQTNVDLQNNKNHKVVLTRTV